MRTSNNKSSKKEEIAGMIDTMTREEMAWTIKLLTDKMLIIRKPIKYNEENRPAWWNRPISEATLALLPKEREDFGDDYKQLLSEALEEKYL